MRVRRRGFLLASACHLAAALALTEEPGARVDYAGGTLAGLRPKTGGHLVITGPGALVLKLKETRLEIPYENVNLLEYGQRAGRRYILALTISPLLLASKSRRHFLTIGFKDAEGRQQAVVFQVHKDDLRALLAGLEARTGLKVEYLDNEARKSGGG